MHTWTHDHGLSEPLKGAGVVVNGLIGSAWINAFMDTTDHELSKSLKGAWVVIKGLIGMSYTLVNYLFVLN
jgi:hypothetical protein